MKIKNIQEIINQYPKLEKDGEVYLVVNASKFSQAHNLNPNYLSSLLRGTRDELQGFTLYKEQEIKKESTLSAESIREKLVLLLLAKDYN